MSYRVVDSAQIGDGVEIGHGSSVWDLVQVRENANIGANCILGRGAYVGPGVTMGDNCKVQNHALIYDPASLGDGVFIGPAAVLTNDVYPRAVAPDGELKGAAGWESVGVTIGDGASIGARSVVLAGVQVGEWALVAAGSVVIRNVPAYAMVAGNPAVQKGWVGRAGVGLRFDGERWVCPETGERYVETDGEIRPE